MKKQMKSSFFHLGLLSAAILTLLNFVSISGAAQVAITWNPNSESDLDGYAVYQSIGTSGPPYELIGNLSLDELADPDNPEVILNLLEDDINYYIAITAYDKTGNESQFSNEICLRIENASIINCAPAGDSSAGSR